MKKALKNSVFAGIVLLIALVIFGGSYIGASRLKAHRDTKRVENMYTLFATKGKLHTEKNAYTYLTATGKERLQSDLSFNKKGLPADTLTAFSEERLVLEPYHYRGKVKLPQTPQKGKRLYFKVPFPVTVSPNLVVTIYFKGQAIDYDSTNVMTKNKKKAHYCYIYLGESTNSEGKLINDLKVVRQQVSQTVHFEINNVEQISDIPHQRHLLKHPNLFYSATELLQQPEISLNVAYHATKPQFKVLMRDYREADLKVKVTSNQVKNYERKLRLQIQPQGQLLSDLKHKPQGHYEVILLYNGLVMKNQYYITNNLAALSNYNHGK